MYNLTPGLVQSTASQLLLWLKKHRGTITNVWAPTSENPVFLVCFLVHLPWQLFQICIHNPLGPAFPTQVWTSLTYNPSPHHSPISSIKEKNKQKTRILLPSPQRLRDPVLLVLGTYSLHVVRAQNNRFKKESSFHSLVQSLERSPELVWRSWSLKFRLRFLACCATSKACI